MEGQSTGDFSQYQYQSAQWSRFLRRSTVSTPVLASSSSSSPSLVKSPHHLPVQVDLFPALFPQQSFQAQLAHYNSLIASSTNFRLHSAPLPPLVSAQHIQAPTGLRSRGASTDQERATRDAARRGGHGHNKNGATGGKAAAAAAADRSLIATNESPSAMSKRIETTPKVQQRQQQQQQQQLQQQQQQQQHSTQATPQHRHIMTTHQSASVPTTPRQRPRHLSFGSREPSPNAPTSHSPRSAYSESSSTLPFSRPIPPLRGCRYETAMAYSRRRMPYNLGADWLEKAKPGSVKPKLAADEEKKMSSDMHDLYYQLLPTPESEAKRAKFVDKLERLLNAEWPGHDIKVHMFGSSGNLLCTDDSDVDICITTKWKELENVCMLAELLAKHGMQKVICVSTAKVPIVKIWDPELRLACDMNVNNTLALENTRMIKTYVEIDDRIRPLAMIIKHWTKKRVVNDAAFGGTLSSYTWICMIISFLQLRKPPILPALHQRPHQSKSRSSGGHTSVFADDLDKLRGFGGPNRETLGELLFYFFRFFGHEMDYDNLVLSVRQGKLVPKVDKEWHQGHNNRLCVEEPFNTSRNLGNTADDTSFRGLHIEIRRAFDLVSKAKLDECCEQYSFPKEEEKIFTRPTASTKVTVAPSSSAHSNRGGRGGSRGGRHNNNSNNQSRNGNNNRRASSGAFDNNNNSNNVGYNMAQPVIPISSHEAWLQTHNAQTQLHNELFTTFSVLQAQENSLRQQLYHQSQAFAHAQANGFANQPQRLHSGPGSSGNGGGGLGSGNGSGLSRSQTTTSSRTRGNSFDNPPLTAPLRPSDMYFYPVPLSSSLSSSLASYQQHHAQQQGGAYGHATSTTAPSTYPSSPALAPAQPELRRSLHRSSGGAGGVGGPGGSASGTGLGGIGGVSGSPLRSHSQPAPRSVPSSSSSMAAVHAAAAAAGRLAPEYDPRLAGGGRGGRGHHPPTAAALLLRQANNGGIAIPNFIAADESLDCGGGGADEMVVAGASQSQSEAADSPPLPPDDAHPLLLNNNNEYGFFAGGDRGSSDDFSRRSNGNAPAAVSAATASSIVGTMAIPAFGDMGRTPRSHRPRDNTHLQQQQLQQQQLQQHAQQLPPVVLEQVRRRTSRSQSPFGHGRAFSSASAASSASSIFARQPLPLRTFAPGDFGPPIVVNGSSHASSGGETTTTNTIGRPVANSSGGTSALDDQSWEIVGGVGGGGDNGGDDQQYRHQHHQHEEAGAAAAFTPRPKEARRTGRMDSAIVVNGSTPHAEATGIDAATAASGDQAHQPLPSASTSSSHWATPSHLQQQQQQQSQQKNGISPLHLASTGTVGGGSGDDVSHLSPVFEAPSPSPTTSRRLEPSPSQPSRPSSHLTQSLHRADAAAKPALKAATLAAHNAAHKQQQQQPHQAAPELPARTSSGVARAGTAAAHTRGAKSEGENPGSSGATAAAAAAAAATAVAGSWQKIPRQRKKGQASGQQQGGLAEQLPKNDAERKGG